MESNNQFVVRQLKTQDLKLFQELMMVFEQVFEMQNFKIPNQDHLQNLLNKPDFIAFVTLSANKVVGGITAYILTSYFVESSDVYILDLAVKEEFQRKGVGKKLMQMLIKHCKRYNMNVMFVQADEEDQHAVNFYHSLGGIARKAINFDYPLT